jgi:hypothetical protein
MSLRLSWGLGISHNMALISNALTTVARTKTLLGITSTTHDALLTQLINQVTGFIENYLSRSLLNQTYTQEEYDGTGTRSIVLKQFPVTAFSQLDEREDVDNEDDWDEISSTDFYWYADGRIKLVSGTFLERPQAYRATYTAGYLIDFASEDDSESHTLPQEIEYVCQKLVSAMFNIRKAEGFTDTRLGDSSLKIRQLVFSNKEVMAMLDKYKSFTI